MSTSSIPGLHHVTTIAGDPAQNRDFYTRILGLRLVKKTVNFDDPHTYHLYFGDRVGSPGTILTFFPIPRARPGQNGTGLAQATAFLIPQHSTDYWRERLHQFDIHVPPPDDRFDEQVLRFRDHDGTFIELVASSAAEESYDENLLPQADDIPAEHAIRAFHSVSLSLESVGATGKLLNLMGYVFQSKEGNRHRYVADPSQPGPFIDLVEMPYRQGAMGKGVVHHVAFRCADDEEQLSWQKTLWDAGISVSEVRDRQYFNSIYFHEPGGVLFEIATDPPGFTDDESVEALGSGLKLPYWLEDRRADIEANLPDLQIT